MNGKCPLKIDFELPPFGGAGGGFAACAAVRKLVSEEPPPGATGGNEGRPDWAAYHTREPNERTTNRQNKAAFEKDHENYRKAVKMKMCRHERRT